MKTFVYHSICFCIFLMSALCVKAQWINTSFPTDLPNRMFATSKGDLLVGEYGTKYVGFGGGLYILHPGATEYVKADVPDYLFTSFVEAEGYVYAFCDNAKFARSKDLKEWEVLSYGNIYDTDYFGDCYAATYYDGKLFCATFGYAPAYSSDGGNKWVVTDISKACGPDGRVYLYGMMEYKGKLYAWGSGGIYRFVDETESWEILVETAYASHAAIHNGKLYVANDYYYYKTCLWETSDGDNWTNVTVAEDYTDNNSIGCICSVGNALYIGSCKGIFYTTDDCKTWNNTNMTFSGKPTCLTPIENNLYAASFATGGGGGVFRYDISGQVSISDPSAEERIRIADHYLTVLNSENVQIMIMTMDGKTVVQECADTVCLDGMSGGFYIYNVMADGKCYAGKFIIR